MKVRLNGKEFDVDANDMAELKRLAEQGAEGWFGALGWRPLGKMFL